LQKAHDAILSRLAVHVAEVVRCFVEWPEWFSKLCRPFLEIVVEQLFPSRGMHVGGKRDHAIEVKDYRS
jgi:hypothetical protein